MFKNKMYYRFLLMNSFLSIDLITSIRVIYMLSYSISEGEISLLKGLYTLIITLAEIPTGIVSDRISRKLSLQISAILFMLHAVFYIIMPNFIGFFFTQFILALSSAFLSGADSGYIDDYIKKYTNDKYIDVLGKIKFSGSFISAFLYLVSGFLFSYSNKSNFIITAVFGLLAFFTVSTFPAIKMQLSNNETDTKNKFHGYLKDVKDVLLYNIKNKNILKITLISTVIISTLIFNFEYYQIMLDKLDFSSKYLGVLYASFMILAGIGSKISKALVEKIKIDFIAVSFMVLISISYILFAVSTNLIPVLVGVIIQQICFGSWNLIAQNEILEHIPAEETKSTMMSMNSLIVSFLRSCFVLMLGLLLSLKGYKISYLAMVMAMTISCILLITVGLKKKKNQERIK